MGYASWSVVFGEQPSAAKWNILGTNDSSFNDSTGINLQYANLTGISNPYKFSAYKSSATQTINTGADTKVTFDVEEFDTNNNFATSTYTCPVAGFYLFVVSLGYNAVASGTRLLPRVYKNGASNKVGDDKMTNAAAGTSQLQALIQCAASDTIEGYGTPVGANTVLTNTQSQTFFQGVLLSKT